MGSQNDRNNQGRNGRNLEDQLFAQMVALKAWQIWKDEGCPDGHAEEHWCRAERELIEIKEIERRTNKTPSLESITIIEKNKQSPQSVPVGVGNQADLVDEENFLIK